MLAGFSSLKFFFIIIVDWLLALLFNNGIILLQS